MKTTRIHNNWLIKAIKTGSLNANDVPCSNYRERYELSKHFSIIQSYWDKHHKNILENMYLPSNAYIHALNKSLSSFRRQGLVYCCFTHYDVETVICVPKKTIQESYGCVYDSAKGSYTLYSFNNDGCICMLVHNDELVSVYYSLFNSSVIHEYQNSLYDFSKYYSTLLLGACFALFEKYAKVETKVFRQGDKIKTKSGRIKNESNLLFTYRTTNYFTEYIRDEEFKVSGHLRLQSYKNGDGEITRKLIYINEFVKHGYHRKATINAKAS